MLKKRKEPKAKTSMVEALTRDMREALPHMDKHCLDNLNTTD
jgi:hypothetical protein